MKKLLTILACALFAGCSTSSPGTSNANVAPVIQSAVQASATYAISQDPALKGDLQTILTALKDVQVAQIVVTPALVEQAVNVAFTKFGSSANHILYIDNLISPYLTDIATDLPYVVAGLNAALNPPAPVVTPVASPATPITTGAVEVPDVLIKAN